MTENIWFSAEYKSCIFMGISIEGCSFGKGLWQGKALRLVCIGIFMSGRMLEHNRVIKKYIKLFRPSKMIH